jgi:hypothetical protein
MKPACEIIVQYILPAIRAGVAKRLIEKYGLSQRQAAERLGTTQPAVSQYKKGLRGYKTGILKDNPRLLELIDSLASRSASGEISQDQLTLEFCNICRYLKSEGDICKLHKELYPLLESCKICLNSKI